MGKRCWIIFFVFLFNFLLAKETLATCSVSISPADVQINSSRDVAFTVNNTGENPILFVKIPTGFDQNVSVTNVSASPWDLSLVSGGFGMVSGSISGGSSASFTVSANFGAEIRSIDWQLEASEQADGSNAFACDSVSMNAVEQTSDPVGEMTPTPTAVPAPSISSIAVSASDTSAVLTWRLDTAASGIIYYGTTNSYGSSVNTGSEGYEKATLTGLSPSTTYHFQIQIIGVGGTTVVADNTFTTAAAGAVSTITNTVTNVVTSTVTNTVTQTNTNTVIIGDTTPPVVTVKELAKEVWSSAPVIEGSAIDNRGVARVEYRVSSGLWISASLKNEVGSKRVEWEALPEVTLDGTYDIEVRAVDIFGNRGLPKKIKIVIDNLPPTVGGAVFFANEVVLPAKNGVVKILEKQPIRAQFKELGGAERVVVLTKGKAHEAVKDKSTSIWNLEIILDSGVYESKIVAVDGAGKKVEKDWVTFEVASKGKIVLEGKEVTNYEVSVWKKDSFGKFRKGETKNIFGWLVPSGQYYLSLQINGRKYLSQVVDFVEPGLLTGVWDLGAPKWWSRFLPAGKPIKLFAPTAKGRENYLKGDLIPNRWYGTKKVVYVMTPDLPYAVEGLTIAKQEAEKIGSNLVVVGLQATKQEIEMWMDGKNIDYMDDWEGKWLSESSLLVLPTKYYLDTFGKVVNIKEGVY